MTDDIYDCSGPPNNSIVKLNVGGKLYVSSYDTLTRIPETFFTGLLNGKISSTMEDGAYFIDRDSKLFRIILNYLRTQRLGKHPNVPISSIMNEAIFFNIQPLIQFLEFALQFNKPTCGSVYFCGYLKQPNISTFTSQSYLCMNMSSLTPKFEHQYVDNTSNSVSSVIPGIRKKIVHILIFSTLIITGTNQEIYCYEEADRFSNSVLIFTSPPVSACSEIIKITALNLRARCYNVSYATNTNVYLYRISSRYSEKLLETEFNDISWLFIIQGQLVSVSKNGFLKFVNIATKTIKTQKMGEISCLETTSKYIFVGCMDGSIKYINMERFPVNMDNNDILINTIISNENDGEVTALSIYPRSTPQTNENVNWIEIAYGTIGGSIYLIVQRPETRGLDMCFAQKFTVHYHPISSLKLTNKYLISVCCYSNHVKTWSVTRFRDIISTKPGPLPIASFNVTSLSYKGVRDSHVNVGPFGEKNQENIFIQRIHPDWDSIRILNAATGELLDTIRSVDGSSISAFAQCSKFSGIGDCDSTGRTIFTGHQNGSVQIWESYDSIKDKQETADKEKQAWNTIEMLENLNIFRKQTQGYDCPQLEGTDFRTTQYSL